MARTENASAAAAAAKIRLMVSLNQTGLPAFNGANRQKMERDRI